MSKRNRPRKKGMRFFGKIDRRCHDELIRIGFKVRRGGYYGTVKIARYYWR